MNIKSKKGFILAAAMLFIIIAGITSIGVYANSFYFAREAAQEVNSIRGYYLSLAGERYAYILLKDPGSLGLSSDLNTTGMQGKSVTINIDSDSRYSAFKNDIGLAAGEKLAITITEYSSSNAQGDSTWGSTCYKVSASYKPN